MGGAIVNIVLGGGIINISGMSIQQLQSILKRAISDRNIFLKNYEKAKSFVNTCYYRGPMTGWVCGGTKQQDIEYSKNKQILDDSAAIVQQLNFSIDTLNQQIKQMSR